MNEAIKCLADQASYYEERAADLKNQIQRRMKEVHRLFADVTECSERARELRAAALVIELGGTPMTPPHLATLADAGTTEG